MTVGMPEDFIGRYLKGHFKGIILNHFKGTFSPDLEHENEAIHARNNFGGFW